MAGQLPKRRTQAIILFGSPGSGKGTQARLLKEQCVKGPHISTGDMLRHHIERQDEIGRQIRDMMKSGLLAPDELVNQLVADRIKALDCAEGFILDGYPRTLNQAAVLRRLTDENGIDAAVVHLVVDYERLVARLSG
ncbi:MAG: adenylate kinase family protein, partial [Candidatus Sulfotelmatobacter sp.]